MAKVTINGQLDIPFDLWSFIKSKCKNILTCRLFHKVALEQYFILLVDFKSFSKMGVVKFFVQNCPIFKKIDFFTPVSTVNKES